MARQRTPEEQTALAAFRDAPIPSSDDAPPSVQLTPAAPPAVPDTPAAAPAPSGDAAPVVVADTPAAPVVAPAPSWRDEIIPDTEDVHPVWRGRKRGEYADAVANSARSNAEAATAAQRDNERLRGELEALRAGRVTLPPKTEPAAPAAPVTPFGAANDDDFYRVVPDIGKATWEIQQQNAAMRSELDALKAEATERRNAEIFAVCDRAFENARTAVAPNATAEQWKEYHAAVGGIMHANTLDPSNPENWAAAARFLKLDRVFAAGVSAPVITAPVIQRPGAPPVGNTTPAAPVTAAAGDERKTTGDAALDSEADEVVSLANRRAKREGRPVMDANMVREQFLKNRGRR